MQFALNGKFALVTGASRGLGYACAQALAKEGCDLLICSRYQNTLIEAAENIVNESGNDVKCHTVDLSNPSTVEKLIGYSIELDRSLDALVISSGGPAPGSILTVSDEQWQDAFRVVLLGPYRLIRGLIPCLSSGSSIVLIGAAGFRTPIENSVLSNSMRAALCVAAKLLSQELNEMNIRVNVVLPGPFATNRIVKLLESWASSNQIAVDKALENRYLDNLSIKRLGKPMELGQLISYLCSPISGFLTGSTITIDGGFVKSLL